MKTFQITYDGNSTQAKLRLQRGYTLNAEDANDAVVKFYRMFMDDNYFPQEDGSIVDEQGREVMLPMDTCISYDGGYFYATEVN
jgi:hypothetical protein